MSSISRTYIITLAISACTAFAGVANVDRQMARMTVDQQLAQLFIIGFDGTKMSRELCHIVHDVGVGGVVFYGGNVESPEQVRALNDEILAAAPPGLPPFIALDQEGGSVERLKTGVPRLPGNMALGATRSPQLSERAGRALGARLRQLGFSMNFAPVCDVLGDGPNPALGARAFSDDPQLVAELAVAFIRGQAQAGLASVAKHFPGEGAAQGDPHYELPMLDRSRQELAQRELIPIRAAIAAGVPAIMTSHMVLPRIAENAETPATLSPRIITGLLRNDLAYDGLVITDELGMTAIRKRRDVGALAVQAVLAGADMLLVAWSASDRDAMFAALRRAHANGQLSDERLRQSVRRVLLLKEKLARERVAVSTDESVAADIAAGSMTLYRSDSGPLFPSGSRVAFLGPEGAVRRGFSYAAIIPTPPRVDEDVVERAVNVARGADVLVAAIASPNEMRLYSAIRARLPQLNVILVVLSAPFAKTESARAVLFAYDDGPESQRAALRVLADGRCAPGVLPIAVQAAGVGHGYSPRHCNR